MYLLAKFGGHKSYVNRYINSYIKSYMNTSEIAELITSLRHTERFSKSGTPIYNQSRTGLQKNNKKNTYNYSAL